MLHFVSCEMGLHSFFTYVPKPGIWPKKGKNLNLLRLLFFLKVLFWLIFYHRPPVNCLIPYRKNWDTLNYHRDCPTNGIAAFYSATLRPNDSDRITNSVDTDQTAP